MKFCKDCKHCETQLVRKGEYGHTARFCSQKECLNPVDGTYFPCEVTRKNEEFCGLKARYFESIVAEPKIVVQ